MFDQSYPLFIFICLKIEDDFRLFVMFVFSLIYKFSKIYFIKYILLKRIYNNFECEKKYI